MAGGTSARLLQSFRGSAGSVAKIIGDYRTLYTSAPSVNRAWGAGGSSRASSSSCSSASERRSLPPNPLACSWERSSGRCRRFDKTNPENRCYACKRCRGNANRCEKCCKKRFLSSFPPQVYCQVHCKHRTWIHFKPLFSPVYLRYPFQLRGAIPSAHLRGRQAAFVLPELHTHRLNKCLSGSLIPRDR